MIRRKSRGVALLMALLLATAACGSDDDDAGAPEPVADDGGGDTGDEAAGDPMAELVAAAEDEGSLLFYTAPNEKIATRVTEAFEAEYDIDLDFVRLASSDLTARYAAEAEAGAPAADLILQSQVAFVDDAIDKGWMVPVDEDLVPAIADFPEGFERGPTYAVQVTPWALCFNTDEVDPDDVPESFEDLADPDYEGELILADPQSTDALIQLWDTLLGEFGEEYLEGVGDNVGTVFPSSLPAAEALAAGEGSFDAPCPGGIAENVRAQGGPIDFVIPELTVSIDIVLGMTKDAAHPNAARLFANWLMTEEGSQVFSADRGNISPFGEPDEQIPPDLRAPRPEWADNKDQILALLGVA